MMLAVKSLAKEVRMKKACEALGIPRASYYYYRKNNNRKRIPVRPPPPLSPLEEQVVLDTLSLFMLTVDQV